MCKNFREKGSCKYGPKCLFAHGEHELSVKEEEIKLISDLNIPPKEESSMK
jgi:hypothetical protein